MRRLFHLAWPVLVGQLAAMGMMVSDTMLVARYSTVDLAAVAVGSGIYVSIAFSLAGVLSALSPTIAHLFGAQRHDDIAPEFQQGVWLALLLSLAGIFFLYVPDPLLALTRLTPEVEARTREYLTVLAFGVPPAMVYRAVFMFNQAIGRPRPMMVISLIGTALHVPLSYALIHGLGPLPELGAIGCAVSNVVVYATGCTLSLAWVRLAAPYRPLHLFAHWQAPRRAPILALVRLGAPMGFSNFVEITSFALIALFVGELGAAVVAGHRVVGNLHGLMFMMPLALGTATLVLVGQAAGARDWPRARRAALTGLGVAGTLAVLFGVGVWTARHSLVALYTPDPAVQTVSLGLIGYSAVFLFFDATHTLASFSLRGYKVSFLPMFVHIVCFWGLGLAGGWWLCFRGLGNAVAPMGAAGFWLMSTLATVAALALMGGLLLKVSAAMSGEG